MVGRLELQNSRVDLDLQIMCARLLPGATVAEFCKFPGAITGSVAAPLTMASDPTFLTNPDDDLKARRLEALRAPEDPQRAKDAELAEMLGQPAGPPSAARRSRRSARRARTSAR